jgi:hypothetical protein
LPELALIEGNQQIATKPDESSSPSLFTFRSYFAAIHHHYYYVFMTARTVTDSPRSVVRKMKSQLRSRTPVHRWASCLNNITHFDGRSTAQEADSIGPVPFAGFPQEIAQGPYEATRIRWRYSLFVNKNHSAMLSLFFRPGFEQQGNRPSIVGNKRQPLHGCLLQAGRVLLS